MKIRGLPSPFDWCSRIVRTANVLFKRAGVQHLAKAEKEDRVMLAWWLSPWPCKLRVQVRASVLRPSSLSRPCGASCSLLSSVQFTRVHFLLRFAFQLLERNLDVQKDLKQKPPITFWLIFMRCSRVRWRLLTLAKDWKDGKKPERKFIRQIVQPGKGWWSSELEKTNSYAIEYLLWTF